MIERLREATNRLHKEIEADNSASRIIDHSITLKEYKLLLLQNYIAYKVTEEEIGKFIPSLEGQKHQRLKKDLEDLDMNTGIVSHYKASFSCSSYAEALGAAYVVEGSALGGMVIAKELKHCDNLEGIKEHHFFNGDRNNVKSWNAFKKELDATELSEEETILATEKAKATFRFFREVFRLNDEQIPAGN